MPFKNVTGIIFDLDGTLTDYESGSEAGLRLALKALNSTSESPLLWEIFQEAYNAVIDAEASWSRLSGFSAPAKETRIRRFQLLLQGLGRQLPGMVLQDMAEAYGQGRSSGTRLYADVKETLKYLKKKYALAILTEGDQTTQMDQIIGMEIDHYFSTIVISNQTPWHKPNPTLFRYTAVQMRAEPENIIMVGDRLDWDILPAKETGMNTIWLNRRGTEELSTTPPVEPDLVIQKLDQLQTVL